MTTSDLKRFWGKVRKTSDCWVWMAFRPEKGYGRFWVNGKNKNAHRISWELANGPIPPGLHVLHRCDNRACVNPAHLFLGTNADNMRDRNEKGRTTHGEQHYSAKLTEKMVHQIRGHSFLPHEVLAGLFGVSRRTINHVINRKTWRFL
jgi:hypothetical protein